MNTLEAVDQCIASIKDDATIQSLCGGRIYRELAPQGATFPYIVFGLMSANDRNMLGPIRAFTRGLYQVRSVTSGNSFDTNNDIMDRVDTLLQDKTLTVDGFRVMPIHRESIARYTEVVAGTRFNHLGFIYRFFSYAL